MPRVDYNMERAELIVIGGGIIGLATAYRFTLRFPGRRVLLLEKEDGIGRHQTGHNSGVIHSGIYYAPGSLKATTCRRGKVMIEDFCRAHGVPFETCGKVVVATEESELPRLDALYARALANGVPSHRLDARRLRELEPHAAGIAALHVPGTGIVDYTRLCAKLVELIHAAGGEIRLRARVSAVRPGGAGVLVTSAAGECTAPHAVNCAGLHSDRVARLAGSERPVRIVPFRGEYYALVPEATHLCRNLIYPVPDPSFPFLGVHFTRMITGGVECGPNAVLAFAREGYTKLQINPRDLWDVLGYRGFWRLAMRHWRMGMVEMARSFSKAAFVRALQRLVPGVRAEHLETAPAGVRAQALAPDGRLVDDFVIQGAGHVTHVLNAPSPAATSSLAIGETIVDRVAEDMKRPLLDTHRRRP